MHERGWYFRQSESESESERRGWLVIGNGITHMFMLGDFCNICMPGDVAGGWYGHQHIWAAVGQPVVILMVLCYDYMLK